MNTKILRRTLGVAAVLGLLLVGTQRDGKTDEPSGRPDLEHPSTAEQIKDAALRGAPIAVWETLEHAERVECLDCLSYVEPLLFDRDARVREIAAWWIRRRPFGYAEIAIRVRDTLATDSDPVRRAAAANALGEFLDGGATPLLVKAIGDSSADVRVAVLGALQRLNDPAGVTAIQTALGDGDPRVRKTAIEAGLHTAGFSDAARVATLLSDPDAVIRAKAADALGAFKAKGSVAALAALTRTDSDEETRIAAVNALGELGDAAGRSAVEAANNDASSRVRDAAHVAGLKLAGSI